VLYFHDGHNLFDAHRSFAGEWRVDETMLALAAEGREAIVVGVANQGRDRIDEYAPFFEPRIGGGKAPDYLRFLVETVKPLSTANSRPRGTRADRHRRLVAGRVGVVVGALRAASGSARRRRSRRAVRPRRLQRLPGGAAGPGPHLLDVGTLKARPASAALLGRLLCGLGAWRARDPPAARMGIARARTCSHRREGGRHDEAR
jgi:hypothetical protein